MSSQQDFFERLKCESLGGEKTDRLERELRAHLEDAGGNEDCLGDPSTIASIYNRVRAQHSAPEWILEIIFLGFFTLLIQYLVVWLLDGMMGQMCFRCMGGPNNMFTPNPTHPFVSLLSYTMFAAVFGVFFLQLRRVFVLTGRTIYTVIASSVVGLIPAAVHAWSYLQDPLLYHSLFPTDLLVTSFGVILLLGVVAFATRQTRVRFAPSPRLRKILWALLIVYIAATSVAFMIPSPDGGLMDISVPWRPLYLLASLRLLLEQAATTMVTSSLSFLSPPVMWNVLGSVLSLGWIVSVIAIGRGLREKRGVSLAGVAGVLYLSSILSFGAKDQPDVEFSQPVQTISLAIEQRQIPMWSSLHAYLQRLGSPFPIYHTAWDEQQNVFIIDQSAWPFRGDRLAPVSSWTIRPDSPVQIESNETPFSPPDESDEDDDTLESLTNKGFTCDTDEPFPSCFSLSYKNRQIFSHNTRSIVVTTALVSPDEHWVLLTLTMRYSGNEYVYLVDLNP